MARPPLFPAAAAARSSAPPPSSAPRPSMAVGADFRPLSGPSSAAAPAPPPSAPSLFPAYNNGGGSASASSASNVAPPNVPRNPAPSGAPTITTASGTRLVHPEEDISLEERRAKFPKYHKRQQPPPPPPQAFGGAPAHSGYGAPPVMYQAG